MIPSSNYVSVRTLFKGSAGSKRSYHLRLFTQSEVMPTNTLLPFYNQSEVEAYYGVGSEEANYAQTYFSYISPTGGTPQQIEMYRYAPQGASPQIFGTKVTSDGLKTLQSESSANLHITLGAQDKDMTIDFTSVLSWGDVANKISTELTPQIGIVKYSKDFKRLEIDGATKGEVNVVTVTSLTAGVLDALGMTAPTISYGAGAMTAVQCLESSLEINGEPTDNFGSFVFKKAEAADYVALSLWNNTKNVLYLFSFAVPEQSFLSQDQYDQIITAEGTAMHFDNTSQGTEVCPCAILSSTEYDKANSVVGYMYRTFTGVLPVVRGDEYRKLDANRFNYIGATSLNGEKFTFYQRGVCTGKSQLLEVYTGAMYVASTIASTLFNRLLNIRILPAGLEGESIVMSLIKADANNFLSAGIISKRELDAKLENEIAQDYGTEAVEEIKDKSYYVSVTTDGTTIEYTFIYTSIVGVRKITGTHVVIGA